MIVINGELPGLNEMTNANRTHWSKGAKLKKEATRRCMIAFMGKKVTEPFKMTCHWYCKNKKKDPDNISSARKFILDGMQEANCIKNDGWDQVKGFEDYFFVDKESPRVEVYLQGVFDLV